jgi:hypothetical protein
MLTFLIDFFSLESQVLGLNECNESGIRQAGEANIVQDGHLLMARL